MSFSPAVNFAAGADPSEIISADFNNDGRLDLATANPGSHSVSVLLGDGAGGFGAAINSALITNTAFQRASVAVADFNSDGHLDLATAMQVGVLGRVDVWMGNGDGTFQAPVAVPLHSPSGPVSVGVADYNADQKMDLVVISDVEYFSGTGGWIEVLLGNGAGAFPSYQLTEGPPASPSLLGIDDLNADGTPDVAVAGNGDYVEVWQGDVSGILWMPYYTTGLGGEGSVGDFTGDGILDLVIAGQTVDVLPGHGDCTFAAPVSNPTSGDPPEAVASADFNGDGKLDVVTAASLAGSVSVLLGRGDGTLIPATAQAASSSPQALTVGDFNADGRPDVAAANAGSNNVSVLLNDGVWQGSKTFVGQSGGNWSTASNWSPAGVPTSSDVVLIADSAVNLSGSAAVRELQLTGTAQLSMQADGDLVLRTSALALGADATLDLNDNALIVDYAGASPAPAVRDYLLRGRNGGSWNGSGITSSTAAVAPKNALGYAEAADLFSAFPAIFSGQSVDATSVVVDFTVPGDANLDGGVDVSDLGIVATNWQGRSQRWSQGDFNYDGNVDVSDLGILATHWQQSFPAPSAPAGNSPPPQSSRSIELIEPQFSADWIELA